MMKTTSTSHETASKPSCMMNVCITQQCIANTIEHVDEKSSQPVTQMIVEEICNRPYDEDKNHGSIHRNNLQRALTEDYIANTRPEWSFH